MQPRPTPLIVGDDETPSGTLTKSARPTRRVNRMPTGAREATLPSIRPSLRPTAVPPARTRASVDREPRTLALDVGVAEEREEPFELGDADIVGIGPG